MSAKPSVTSQKKRLSWLLLLSGLLLVALWLGQKGWRVFQAVRDLQARQEGAVALMAGGPAAADPAQAEALLLAVRADVLVLKQETAPLLPLAPLLGWVPRLGPALASAPALMEMADAGTEAATSAMHGLKPALTLLQSQAPGNPGRLPALMQLLDEAGPDLAHTSLSLERLVQARAQLVDSQALPWTIRQYLPLLDRALPLAQDGLRLGRVLPAMMGTDGRRTYLVIAQNEDELRATGGFISGVGLLVVDQGDIVSISFDDANVVDDYLHKPYDFPPEPLYQFMGSELFLFRDANFWPDFATSAEAMMQLYTYGQGVELDGVIALDQRFLQLLLQAVGPVTISELGATVDAGNVSQWLRQAWGNAGDGTLASWMQERKSFMGPLAVALRTRLETQPASIDPLYLLQTMHEAAQTRHLQLYMRNPEQAAVFGELGWDGRLLVPQGQDLLMVVDSNMGFNKANGLVDSELAYQVDLQGQAPAQAALTIRYRHRGTPSAEPCVHQTVYNQQTTYAGLMDDCLWNFTRVYAPAGASLEEATLHPVPASYFVTGREWPGQAQAGADPSGLAVFQNFLLIHRAETVESSYHYQLPPVVQTSPDGVQQYRLTVFKQAGTRPQPLTVVVTLPAGARLLSAEGASSQEGNRVAFQTEFDRNVTFTVQFRPGDR